MIKFTLHSFTVSHVINYVMDLRDVISTSAVHGLYNRVNPLSPIPVSSITQQPSDLYGYNSNLHNYYTRHRNDIVPPLARSSIRSLSFFVYIAKKFNEISGCIDFHGSSINTFKSKVINYLRNKDS